MNEVKEERTADCWHAANMGFTAKQRHQFNKWHSKMFDAIDQMETKLSLIPHTWDTPPMNEAQIQLRKCSEILAEVPWMYG